MSAAPGRSPTDSSRRRRLLWPSVQRHRSVESCWVALYGDVYDVTSFLAHHPGGTKVILQLAGRDATQEYDPVHPGPPLTLDTAQLDPTCKIGRYDASSEPVKETGPIQGAPHRTVTMTLHDCLNLDDIEKLATQKLSKKAWAYYYSAADDLVSKRLNSSVYRQILLRPRVFVDVSKCDTSTTLLGNRVSLPFFVSPAAQARLGHPSGEHGIAQACRKNGALQIISNAASQTPEDICKHAPPDQIFGWQMYIMADRSTNEAFIARINKIRNIKFLVITLDAMVIGKREDDERQGQAVASQRSVRASVQQTYASSTITGTTAHDASASPSARGAVISSMSMGTAMDLQWRSTLDWVIQHTKLPIVLKGLQTHEDVYIASLYSDRVKAVILSNHGGREADTAPPSIHTLLEVRTHCPEVFNRIEIWLDGGIKRGTDVAKALALGAKGVGLGRAPLFGLSAGGVEGVERVLDILKSELETTMRLLGVEKVSQLGPQHVSAVTSFGVCPAYGTPDFRFCSDLHGTHVQINTRAVERDVYDGKASRSKLNLWLRSFL